jgi:hypothetical protein
VPLGALAVAAALAAEVRAAAEALQVAEVVVAAQDHVGAAPAVAPVGAALGHVRLTPEREAAVAPGPGLDLDARAVVQHRDDDRGTRPAPTWCGRAQWVRCTACPTTRSS